MDDTPADYGGVQFHSVVDQNNIGIVPHAQKAFFVFSDDASGNGGAHLQWHRQPEAPVDVVFDHGQLRSGASSQWRHAVDQISSGEREAVRFQNHFHSAHQIFPRLAAGGGARVADNRDPIGSAGRQNQPNHFEGDVVAV